MMSNFFFFKVVIWISNYSLSIIKICAITALCLELRINFVLYLGQLELLRTSGVMKAIMFNSGHHTIELTRQSVFQSPNEIVSRF